MKFELRRVQWNEGMDEVEHVLQAVPEQWHSRVTKEPIAGTSIEEGAIIELHNLEELTEFGDGIHTSLVCTFWEGRGLSGSITIYDDYME